MPNFILRLVLLWWGIRLYFCRFGWKRCWVIPCLSHLP